MIQLSEHWKKNLSEISCLPRNPSMLKKTDLLNCEICNGKIFSKPPELWTGVSYRVCQYWYDPWEELRTGTADWERTEFINFLFSCFLKKRYYNKKNAGGIFKWKHINIGHLVHWQPWLEPFIPAIKHENCSQIFCLQLSSLHDYGYLLRS